MIAGLPITGIGGIFYLLLALAMPFVEFYRLCCGRSSKAAWMIIARQIVVQLGVLITVALQAGLIALIAPGASKASNEALGMTQVDTFAKNETAGIVAGSTFLALCTLAIVALMVQCLKLYFQLRRKLATA